MAVTNLVKRIQDIMRNDAGVDGDAQRISQMTWMFFLKVYASKEEEWEFYDDKYVSLIPEKLKWRNWAIDDKSNDVMTGDKLLSFVNNLLFSYFYLITDTNLLVVWWYRYKIIDNFFS